MKVIWEPDDIRCGTIVKQPHIGELAMIGYSYDVKGNKQYHLIFQNDGSVSLSFPNKEVLTEYLNHRGFVPHNMEQAYQGCPSCRLTH
jgi:hypothetical protein